MIDPDVKAMNEEIKEWDGNIGRAMYVFYKLGWSKERLSLAVGYSEEIVGMYLDIEYILSGDRAKDRRALVELTTLSDL